MACKNGRGQTRQPPQNDAWACVSSHFLPGGNVRYDACCQHSPTVYIIYDSDFVCQFRASNVDEGIATIIRDYIQKNIPRAGQYRAAVDEVIASPDVQSEGQTLLNLRK